MSVSDHVTKSDSTLEYCINEHSDSTTINNTCTSITADQNSIDKIITNNIDSQKIIEKEDLAPEIVEKEYLTIESIEKGIQNDHTENMGSNILAFCSLLGRLKHLPRAGWLRYNMRDVEPVAGHMYRMAVLAFCLDDFNKPQTAPGQGQGQGLSQGQGRQGSPEDGGSASASAQQKINQHKCIKMALVHDMAESIVGDITPHDGISKEEKLRRENEAMKTIASILPPRLGTEMYELWREYEAQKTPESQIVKQLDRFDLMVQAFEYEKRMDQPKALQEFFQSASRTIKTEPVLSWYNELTETREKEAAQNPKISAGENKGKHT